MPTIEKKAEGLERNDIILPCRKNVKLIWNVLLLSLNALQEDVGARKDSREMEMAVVNLSVLFENYEIRRKLRL